MVETLVGMLFLKAELSCFPLQSPWYSLCYGVLLLSGTEACHKKPEYVSPPNQTCPGMEVLDQWQA